MQLQPNAQAQSHALPDMHLQRLRDVLDLPHNTLQSDGLFFVLADKYPVVARCADAQHLSLICEVGRLGALGAKTWQALLVRLTAAYDYAFPVSPLAIDGKLALVWRCDAAVQMDQWLRWAEDALTFVLDLQERIDANTL
ncbi:hypothetical protein ACFQUU_28265 [Herbaspirillum sp. GCM10030257]|uniref:hypothetical protein n=1 Tax=Herbaspirillum sp. GCM10030257 TaxID=3273393 RepID=UPI0036162448